MLADHPMLPRAMNAPPPASAGGTTGPNERSCYCGLWETNPEFLREQGVPEGHCGICQRCGAPGHTRHFPGPVPYTGAWCDACYRVVGRQALLWRPLPWLVLAGLGGVIWFFISRHVA